MPCVAGIVATQAPGLFPEGLMLAAAAMSLSSAGVAGNVLRLRGVKT